VAGKEEKKRRKEKKRLSLFVLHARVCAQHCKPTTRIRRTSLVNVHGWMIGERARGEE